MSPYLAPARPQPFGPILTTEPDMPDTPTFPHISDAEFINAAGRIENHPVYANRPPRDTRVDQLGYGRWESDYLTARARGDDHETAARKMEAAIFAAAGGGGGGGGGPHPGIGGQGITGPLGVQGRDMVRP